MPRASSATSWTVGPWPTSERVREVARASRVAKARRVGREVWRRQCSPGAWSADCARRTRLAAPLWRPHPFASDSDQGRGDRSSICHFQTRVRWQHRRCLRRRLAAPPAHWEHARPRFLGLRWSEVDFDRKVLTLPPQRTKAGGKNRDSPNPSFSTRARYIGQASDGVRSRRGSINTEAFHCQRLRVSGCPRSGARSGVRKVFERVCKEAKLENLRIHDCAIRSPVLRLRTAQAFSWWANFSATPAPELRAIRALVW